MVDRTTLMVALTGALAFSATACSDESQSSGDAAANGGAADAVVADTEITTPETPATLPVATVNGEMQGDLASGARVFRQCMACHVLQEGVNRVGPSLHGVIGREAGALEDFRYSDVNKNSNVVWTEESLSAYLENPRSFMPGTIMSFAGLRDPQQRADVIAYIKANGGEAD